VQRCCVVDLAGGTKHGAWVGIGPGTLVEVAKAEPADGQRRGGDQRQTVLHTNQSINNFLL